MKALKHPCTLLLLTASLAFPAAVIFDNDHPNNNIGVATGVSNIEHETGDDFLLGGQTSIISATFTGLFLAGQSVPTASDVAVEIYRVFPLDSDTGRTPNVPTRANSPSDVAFTSRDSGAGELLFGTSVLNANFTANNSVVVGIHPSPTQTTG